MMRNSRCLQSKCPVTLRRLAGTTMIEILVTIVVFLVGILAIAQIFPGGIRILNETRNTSIGLSLARTQLERLTANPEVVPEQVVPIDYQLIGPDIIPVNNPMKGITDHSPTTTGITNLGEVEGTAKHWQLVSGPNTVRRIIGESHTIGSPRLLSTDPAAVTAEYGSLVSLEFGPPEHVGGQPLLGRFAAYSRDLASRLVRGPQDKTNLRDYEYGVSGPFTAAATFSFPARPTSYPGTRVDAFRVSFQAVTRNGANVDVKRVRDFVIVVPANDAGFFDVPVATIPGVIAVGGEQLASIEQNSIRISRIYQEIPAAQAFNPLDPYTFKLVNGRIGQYVFNPVLSKVKEERSGLASLPPLVKFDYDVRDWRILHEDFRIGETRPFNLPVVIRLALTSLKTNSKAGADNFRIPSHQEVLDGTDAVNHGMEDVYVVNNNQIPGANTQDADNMLIIDLNTGGQVLELYQDRPVFQVDKSTGTVTFFDFEPANPATDPGLRVPIAFADGSVRVSSITGRTLRFYYMARNEWAIQLSRSAARYTTSLLAPLNGEMYLGGTGALAGSPTRIYFPAMDANRKVSIGKIRYIYNNGAGNQEGVLEGAEFQIRFRPGSDTVTMPLPSIDLRDVIPNAVGFSQGTYSVNDVSGISIVTRVFNNSGSVKFGTNFATNLTSIFQGYASDYRVVTKETFLPRGVALR